jgi:hypothetical protein
VTRLFAFDDLERLFELEDDDAEMTMPTEPRLLNAGL